MVKIEFRLKYLWMAVFICGAVVVFCFQSSPMIHFSSYRHSFKSHVKRDAIRVSTNSPTHSPTYSPSLQTASPIPSPRPTSFPTESDAFERYNRLQPCWNEMSGVEWIHDHEMDLAIDRSKNAWNDQTSHWGGSLHHKNGKCHWQWKNPIDNHCQSLGVPITRFSTVEIESFLVKLTRNNIHLFFLGDSVTRRLLETLATLYGPKKPKKVKKISKKQLKTMTEKKINLYAREKNEYGRLYKEYLKKLAQIKTGEDHGTIHLNIPKSFSVTFQWAPTMPSIANVLSKIRKSESLFFDHEIKNGSNDTSIKKWDKLIIVTTNGVHETAHGGYSKKLGNGISKKKWTKICANDKSRKTSDQLQTSIEKMDAWTYWLKKQANKQRLIGMIWRTTPSVAFGSDSCSENQQLIEWNGYMHEKTRQMNMPILDLWNLTFISNKSHRKEWPGERHPCALPSDQSHKIHSQLDVRKVFLQVILNAIRSILIDQGISID